MRVSLVMTALFVGVVASAVPSQAELRPKSSYNTQIDDDLTGSGMENDQRQCAAAIKRRLGVVSSRLRRSDLLPRERMMLAFTQSRLQYNDWLRGHSADLPQMDIYSIQLLCARIVFEYYEERPLSYSRLASEIAPEFVSMQTALRYIHRLEATGYIRRVRNGRENLVEATPRLLDLYRSRVDRHLEVLRRNGVVANQQSDISADALNLGAKSR